MQIIRLLATQKGLPTNILWQPSVLYRVETLRQLALLQTRGVLGHDQMIDAVLNIAVHEGREVVDGVVDAVVGDASLGIVVGTYLGRAVTRRHHRLALRGNVVDVLLMSLIL